MLPQEEARDDKDWEDCNEDGDVFQLPSDGHGPSRGGSVMQDRREKAAGAQSEEESKRKQPRETELLRINCGASAAERECNKRHNAEQNRQAGKAAALEILAFRRRPVMQAIAHFFGASGFAGDLVSAGFASPGFASAGLFSAGFSKSARCSGGTSTIPAF